MYSSWIAKADGMAKTMRAKFVRQQTAQVMLNALIGIRGHMVFESRPTTIVNEVKNNFRLVVLIVKAIRLPRSFLNTSL